MSAGVALIYTLLYYICMNSNTFSQTDNLTTTPANTSNLTFTWTDLTTGGSNIQYIPFPPPTTLPTSFPTQITYIPQSQRLSPEDLDAIRVMIREEIEKALARPAAKRAKPKKRVVEL